MIEKFLVFFKSFRKGHIGEGITEQFGDVRRVMCGSLKLVTQECTLQIHGCVLSYNEVESVDRAVCLNAIDRRLHQKG